MADVHLAQFNVARARSPLASPELAGFVAMLEPVNALADGAPGFVWRLKGDGSNDATSLRPYGGDVIVNLSVWRSREALWQFVYRSGHLEAMRGRRAWFAKMAEAASVLFWVPAGHVPSVDEAVARLEALRREGPSPRAFTFHQAYDPAGAPAGALAGLRRRGPSRRARSRPGGPAGSEELHRRRCGGRLVVAEAGGGAEAELARLVVAPAAQGAALEQGAGVDVAQAHLAHGAADVDRAPVDRPPAVADGVDVSVAELAGVVRPPAPYLAAFEQRARVSAARGDLGRLGAEH
ncbi:MAG TPA: DUF3291 domain-containing protein, partial [Polyangiaceae bacterium]|nr:DUF3291 domain-containing protein [Polyangiaceae bacterium]